VETKVTIWGKKRVGRDTIDLNRGSLPKKVKGEIWTRREGKLLKAKCQGLKKLYSSTENQSQATKWLKENKQKIGVRKGKKKRSNFCKSSGERDWLVIGRTWKKKTTYIKPLA